jgi:hypothetical protein
VFNINQHNKLKVQHNYWYTAKLLLLISSAIEKLVLFTSLVFLPCEAGPFSSALPVLITHVIKLQLNPLINPPGRQLTLNVWDVICIWARDRDIINPLRRGDKTISGSIGHTWGNSWRCQVVMVLILGVVCELVSREGIERLFIDSLCGKWGRFGWLPAYAADFSIVVGDLETWRPALFRDSCRGSWGLMGILFCRQRENKYPLRGWWAKWAHFVIFDSFWILTKKTLEIWNFFSPMILRFHLVFYIFLLYIFIFFSKNLNLNSKNCWFFNSFRSKSSEFQKNAPHLLTLGHDQPYNRSAWSHQGLS